MIKSNTSQKYIKFDKKITNQILSKNARNKRTTTVVVTHEVDWLIGPQIIVIGMKSNSKLSLNKDDGSEKL